MLDVMVNYRIYNEDEDIWEKDIMDLELDMIIRNEIDMESAYEEVIFQVNENLDVRYGVEVEIIDVNFNQ